MASRRALLLSVVILFLTVLALSPVRNTSPHTALHSQAIWHDSLPSAPVAQFTKRQQSLIQANLDGSFSTKHLETACEPNCRRTNPAKPVDVVFPRRFSEPVAIKSDGAAVRCAPLNANPDSYSEMEDETLIYRDAFPGCDVKYRSSTYKTEEFIIVKDFTALDAGGKVSWSWDIQTQYEGKQLSLRITPMHTIELVDDNSVPRLRIDAPFGKDGAGTPILAEKHLKFSLVGARLRLQLDAAGLQLPFEIDPSWSSTGNLALARKAHTSTVLQTGKVLVAGGLTSNTSGSETTSCELYDPITETWQATGGIIDARYGHQATLLPNGKVLISGGSTGVSGQALPWCELYDPTTGTWSSASAMSTGRKGHTATLLNNGKVLVTGGLNNVNSGAGGTVDSTCDLYDIAGGNWSTAASMGIARWSHSACLLGDGRVLVEGGYNAYSYQIYDPTSNVWTTPKPTLFGRYGHATITLVNGSVLIAGGSHHQNGPSMTSELYDPIADTRVATSATIASYPETALAALSNGRIAAAGTSVEFYNASSGLWGPSSPLEIGVRGYGISLLNSGDVLFSGGYSNVGNVTGNPLNQCFLLKMSPPAASSATYSVHGNPSGVEVNVTLISYTFNSPSFSVNNPAHGQLSGAAPNLVYKSVSGYVGNDSFTFQVTDGAFGTSGSATIQIQITNTAPTAMAQNVSIEAGNSVAIGLSASDPDDSSLSYSIVGSPAHGVLSGNGADLTYTPDPSFSGIDAFTFQANDGLIASNIAQVSIQIAPSPPVISSAPTANPNPANLGQTISFAATATDIGTHTEFTWNWNFGDGTSSNQQNTSHAYSAVGDYAVELTVTDAANSSTTTVLSVHVGQKPTARFTTSDIVGFVGLPFTFDATLSTDPENAISAYAWNFGDGSPAGSGQLTSKIYTTAGTYSVTLTLSDAEGLTASTQRLVEILPAEQIGIFNAFVEYKTSFDRSKTGIDSLTLKARLNVGDSLITEGSVVALEIAGQRFEATLNRKLQAKTNVAPKQTWKIQFATRKQSAGQVDVQFTVKNADLGLGFNQLGAVTNPDRSASITVPVRLEIGTNAFEIPCDTDFDFNKAGTKAKGEGASE